MRIQAANLSEYHLHERRGKDSEAKAPTARNVIAQVNALGKQSIAYEALQARNLKVSAENQSIDFAPSALHQIQLVPTSAAGPGYYISRRWRFEIGFFNVE